jgi:hypothetical protein
MDARDVHVPVAAGVASDGGPTHPPAAKAAVKETTNVTVDA